MSGNPHNKFKGSFQKQEEGRIPMSGMRDRLKISTQRRTEFVRKQSKSWGQKKFRPKPFQRSSPEPPVPEVSKPWQHVRNDILEDEEEQRSSQRFDMDSQQAKEILKQREQSHRRNIIEQNRNVPTKWESFEDNTEAATKSKPKPKKERQHPKPFLRIRTRNPEELSTSDRNFVRKKLTRMVFQKNNVSDVPSMIKDLKRNNYLKPQKFKKFPDNK